MMLRVDNIWVQYGHLTAIRDVSLQVAEHEIVTVIGSNGAGKTSLLNAISGALPLAKGSIWLADTQLSGLRPHRTVQLGLGYVPEGRELFGSMSVRDNLLLGAYTDGSVRGIGGLKDVNWCMRGESVTRALEYAFALFPILKERQKQKAGSLSGGEQQMLAIGRALMSSPRMLVLDEPSLGLAPNVVREILRLLRRLREDGLAILLVEQDATAALKIADRAYVMDRGRITIEGTGKELLVDDRVRQAYLGKSVA